MSSSVRKTVRIINIAKEFSPFPAGRFESDGPNSGELFREKILYPALQEAETLEIVLDGGEGYGSSFLDEAFGGLVRAKGMLPDELLARIKFISRTDPSLIDEIQEYIRDAQKANK